ncbi:MAG: hypothetical protein M5R36_19830 [Deltaproteobacteria bacterium]|nr:hypothetical protein [Deltaproteobacteria bacterium]
MEADPGLLNFGEAVMPNAYKLRAHVHRPRQSYAEGDTSVLGHLWASYSNVNDHAEKAFLAGGLYPLPDMDPVTRPPSGTIFKNLLDHGVPFRSYGQIIGLANDLDRFRALHRLQVRLLEHGHQRRRQSGRDLPGGRGGHLRAVHLHRASERSHVRQLAGNADGALSGGR